MKCPSCNFVCSDLRDICPRCLEDLRPHKASIGLPITNPNAAYQNLVEKVSPRLKSDATSSDSAEGLLNRIGSFFREESLAPVDKRADSEDRQTDDDLASSSPLANGPIGTSTDDNAIITKGWGGYTALEASIDRRIDSELDPPPDILERPIQSPAPGPTPNSPGPPQPEQPASIDSATRDREWLATIQVDEAEAHSDEINRLFTATLREIVLYDDQMQFELAGESFLSKEHDEHLELLFDLADDEIVDPSTAKRFEAIIETSAERHVESEDLSKQLAKIEQVIDAKMPSLGSFQAASVAANTSTHAAIITPLQPLVPAGTIRRMVAFVFDSISAIAIVAGLTLLGIWIYEPVLFAIVSDSANRDLALMALLVERLAPILVLVVLFYPILMLALFRRTIGSLLTGIRLSSSDGHAPRLSGILVRAFSWPISVLLGGFLPLLLGRETLHDHLSKTSFFRKAQKIDNQ